MSGMLAFWRQHEGNQSGDNLYRTISRLMDGQGKGY
jgi:hypothetical protein